MQPTLTASARILLTSLRRLFLVRCVKASRKDKILLKETNTTKLFPSQYSTTNSKEWFAENFSLYHQKGLRKYCSEDFIEFYEKEVLTRT